MAVNEFIHRIQGFRGPKGSASERRRLFIHCEDRKTGGKIRDGCDLCDKQNFWGRGDMDPFLNRIWDEYIQETFINRINQAWVL